MLVGSYPPQDAKFPVGVQPELDAPRYLGGADDLVLHRRGRKTYGLPHISE